MTATDERESVSYEWLTVGQFCKRHNLGRNLVYDAVREKCIRSVKIGGKILIHANALDELADVQAVGPA
tara:strand:- start:637 stop:843 length:207 start_codon:yes stop_codon:yes gene_type:complete